MTTPSEGLPKDQPIDDWLCQELTRRGLDIRADASQADMINALVDYDDYQRNLAVLRAAGVSGDFTPDEAREIVHQHYIYQLRKDEADRFNAVTGMNLPPARIRELRRRAVDAQILGVTGANTLAEAAGILEAQIKEQTGDHMVYSVMGTCIDRDGDEWEISEGPEGESYFERR